MVHNRHLFSTVFITGAAVLILEVAAVRILSPYYGSSLYVFSSVLTVILAALSIGYWYGGKRADERKSLDDLFRLITISGLLVLGLLFLSQLTLPDIGPRFAVTTGPLFFSALLFFYPAFLLGIVSPYIIKLQSLNTPPEHIGSVVGQTFFWGTLGSIVGSLATGFVLIPMLGVMKTILLVGILLLAIGILFPLYIGRSLSATFVSVVVITALVIALLSNFYQQALDARYVYHTDGQYSAIAVQDFTFHDRPARLLLRDTNNSSAIFTDGTDLLFPYTQFALLYDRLVPEPKNFLMIGGGAYTVPRTLTARDTELQIDVVEIEAELFPLAIQYFDLTDTTHINNHVADGRVFLRNTETTYDVIFEDAFGTDVAAPFHLTTLEFFRLVRSKLNDEGIFILNFVGTPKTIRPSLAGSVTKTLLAAFPNTRAFALHPDTLAEKQNVIFIARNGSNPIDVDEFTIISHEGTEIRISDLELDLSYYQLEHELLLTDDHAPVEYLLAKQK